MNIIQRAEAEYASFEAWKTDFLAKVNAGIKEVEDALASLSAVQKAASEVVQPGFPAAPVQAFTANTQPDPSLVMTNAEPASPPDQAAAS